MLDTTQKLAELLRRDDRYRLEGYVFVMDALQYAQQQLGRGCLDGAAIDDDMDDDADRHVTGQELCESIRQYALKQYGLMAKPVFTHWGVRSTADFGEIVYNLIEIGNFRKTETDSRDDFVDVFDFDTDLRDLDVFYSPESTRSERSQ